MNVNMIVGVKRFVVFSWILISSADASDIRYRLYDLGTLGGPTANALAISDNGIIVGESDTGVADRKAFIWVPGFSSLKKLPDIPSSIIYNTAWSVNRSGNVAGIAYDASYDERAVVWLRSGVMKFLPTLGGYSNQGFSINAHGVVVGRSETYGSGIRGFIWSQGFPFFDSVVEMPLLPGGLGHGEAHAINDQGTVVGSSTHALSDGTHATIWDLYSMSPNDLDRRVQLNSAALAVNQANDVVGWAQFDSIEYRAFLIKNANLGQWILLSANAINHSGQIVGYGWHQGAYRAFLLKPIH